MKRINVDKISNSQHPFWMPWGIGGLIWRYLVFLIALVLFLLLLLWLMWLNPLGSANSRNHDVNYDNIDDPYLHEIIDDDDPMPYRNIEDRVKELPAPEDNRLYDVPDDEMIVNPQDTLKQIVSSRLNIILDSSADDSTYNRFAEEFKALYPSDSYFINYYNPLTKMMQITVPPADRVQIKENLPQQITDIDFKIFYEEIFINAASAKDHNDPAFQNEDQSWHFAPVQAYDAWEITTGSPDIVVAVIDSYIDISHPELKGRITKPYSVPLQSKNVLPPAGKYSFERKEDGPIFHGTHVAALAVGALDNNSGAAGIAPECTLMPISVGNQITSMKLLDALLYAIHQGADVVNISIANYYPEGTDRTPIDEQLEYIMSEARDQQEVWDYAFHLADERNCMIVWAAGNCNVLSGLDETKRNDSTLRVSAVDPDLNKADFSNYGNFSTHNINFSDISAPGSYVYSAGPGNAYGFCGGTSMAAPIVTGAVALMKSINPKLTNSEIIQILKETGKPLDEKQHIGNLLQIRDALEAVSGEMANFDRIQENPDELVGTWETTEQRTVIDTETGKPTGTMCHIFLKFDSPNGGTIYYKEDNGHTYTAPFTSKITKDLIVIDQQSSATSQTTNTTFVPNHLECRRGENGLLKCRSKNAEEFYLIRSGKI